ncbi:diguanylate cyclase (GGDEF)-like protein [Pseudomonas duriflava]|uniref:diguanylate cyclase n=1 Tax=Pseudomonas duriflava TaxID=459528 RepID=A0A562Q8G0_9PSED|nr:diguanylate cyclase [Pseudomonas duriflava]TWI53045.1 diguanylate cyclase (GGDEF)-like protein [Pseudomonas duriflava]
MTNTASQLRSRFILIIIMLVINILVPLLSTDWIKAVLDEYEVHEFRLHRVQQLLSAIKDGETGQRGFILTGREDYLTPLFQGYAEVDHLLGPLAQELDPDRFPEFTVLQQQIIQQRNYWNSVIELRREQGQEAAIARVNVGEGKRLMDLIRQEAGAIEARLKQQGLMLEQTTELRRQIVRIALLCIALLDLFLIALLYKFTFRILRETQESERKLFELSEELAHGMERLRLRNHETVLMSRMAGALHSTTDFPECYDIITRFAKQLFGSAPGCIHLYHPSRDVLEMVGAWNGWEAQKTLFEPHQCWSIRRGQTHKVSDVSTDLICSHMTDIPLAGDGYACVPLMAQGEPIGVLTLCSHPVSGMELAEAFAEQVSLGVANLALRDSLRHQSIVDALTGLHNRRFLDETLSRELLRAGRNQATTAVVLLDVDHFKRFNDNHGHEAGDAVLRHLAVEMKRLVRASDLACRYGGEEFALILPDCTPAGALSRCEALREAVSHMQVIYGGGPLGPISISLGIALYPQHGTHADQLLHTADKALYEAKNRGRNQVYMSDLASESDSPALTDLTSPEY